MSADEILNIKNNTEDILFLSSLGSDSLIYNFTCLGEMKHTPCIAGVCIKISQGIPSRKGTKNLPKGEVSWGFVAISKSQKPSSINGNLKK